MAIHAYVPGKSSAPGVAQSLQAVVERDAARPESARGRAYRELPDILRTIPTAALRLARSHRGAFGLDRTASFAGRSDDLLNLSPAPIWRTATRRSIRPTAPGLPDRDAPSGAKPVVAAETNYTADVDAILAAVTARTRSCSGGIP